MKTISDKAFTKIAKLSPEDLRRYIEGKLQELDTRNALLDSISDGYIVTDSSNKIVYCNTVVSDLIKVSSADKYYGHSLDKFILEPQILAFMHKAHGEAEFEVQNLLNGTRNIRVECKKCSGIEGKVFCIQDVTFFKKIKEEFKKNESLAAMTTMAAGVAHEIKNPLASISIYLQMLDMKLEKQGSVTYEEANKSLQVIKDEVDRINRIAVDFNFAVKPVNAVMESININDVISKTYDLIYPELTENNILCAIHSQNSVPKVKADPNLVEQALLNLLKNAVQAILAVKDDRKRLIEINTYVEDDMVKVDITDNGCGMSEAQRSRIFEPYFTTKETGTGLGLTLLFKIMKEHDGDVGVTSRENEGSTFSLMFPIPQSERYRIEQ